MTEEKRMVDTKKEQEREELHRAIWAIADELRGAVDGWDFKNYVLGTMFYRYISENLCNYINSGEIDATSDCVEVTNNNKLTPENIDRIVDVFAKREEVEYFSHLASYEEVSNNAYNLSVSTYVEAQDTREKIDIVKLNAEIKEIVAREQVLRDEIDKIIAEIEVSV